MLYQGERESLLASCSSYLGSFSFIILLVLSIPFACKSNLGIQINEALAQTDAKALILINDIIRDLTANDTNSALVHLELVQNQLSSFNTDDTSVELAKLLLNDTVQDLEKEDIPSALLHIRLTGQQLGLNATFDNQTNLHANSTGAVSTTKSDGMESEEKSITPIAYTMTGGEIANITVVKENATLLLDIVTNDDGTLILKLPRNIIDSKSPQNEDEDYILFADGLQIGADEIITNDQVRTLSIDFDNRVKQIEIIGSSPPG
jgi:hypothetical protein